MRQNLFDSEFWACTSKGGFALDSNDHSGAGAITVKTVLTYLTTTGAQALTLADGHMEDQIKMIRMIADGGDGTLTPANLNGGTTLTFGDVGDFVILQWRKAEWHVVFNSGVTLA
jgi:hypothetical protein